MTTDARIKLSVDTTEIDKAKAEIKSLSEGSKDLGSTLETVGKQGGGLGNSISSVSDKMGGLTTKTEGATGATQGLTTKLSSALRSLGGFKASASGASLAAAGLTVGLMGAVGAIVALVGVAGAATGKLMRLADAAHTSSEANQELARDMGILNQNFYAFEIAAQQAGTELSRVSGNITTMRSKVQEGSDAFARLGVSTKLATGETRNMENILRDSIDALQGIEDESERAALAQEVFGQSVGDTYEELVSVTEGLDAGGEAADRYGLNLQAAAEANRVLTEAADHSKNSTDALNQSIATNLAPSMADLRNAISNTRLKFAEFFTETENGQAVLRIFSGFMNITKGVVIAAGAVIRGVFHVIGLGVRAVEQTVNIVMLAIETLVRGTIALVADGIALVIDGIQALLNLAETAGEYLGLSGLSGAIGGLNQSLGRAAEGLRGFADRQIQSLQATYELNRAKSISNELTEEATEGALGEIQIIEDATDAIRENTRVRLENVEAIQTQVNEKALMEQELLQQRELDAFREHKDRLFELEQNNQDKLENLKEEAERKRKEHKDRLFELEQNNQDKLEDLMEEAERKRKEREETAAQHITGMTNSLARVLLDGEIKSGKERREALKKALGGELIEQGLALTATGIGNLIAQNWFKGSAEIAGGASMIAAGKGMGGGGGMATASPAQQAPVNNNTSMSKSVTINQVTNFGFVGDRRAAARDVTRETQRAAAVGSDNRSGF